MCEFVFSKFARNILNFLIERATRQNPKKLKKNSAKQ
jgi:hypothetical protein